MITRKTYGTLFLAWFVFITILFFLPGSSLPHDGWLSGWHVDKFVHVGFFFVATWLWKSYSPSRPHAIMILLICLIYGLFVEYVQKNWVPNRDFDLYDVVADMGGSILGLIGWGLYKKNKPL